MSELEEVLNDLLNNSSQMKSTNWSTVVLQIFTILILFLKPVIMTIIKNHFQLKNKQLDVINNNNQEQIQQTQQIQQIPSLTRSITTQNITNQIQTGNPYLDQYDYSLEKRAFPVFERKVQFARERRDSLDLGKLDYMINKFDDNSEDDLQMNSLLRCNSCTNIRRLSF